MLDWHLCKICYPFLNNEKKIIKEIELLTNLATCMRKPAFLYAKTSMLISCAVYS